MGHLAAQAGGDVVISIRYLVRDVDAAAAFYVERLGFKLEQQYGPAMAILTHEQEGSRMTLWLAGPTASASKPMPDGRRPEPGGWNRFVLQVPDIEALVARLRAAGVPLRNEIIRGPGGAQVLVEDPSGNAVELFQRA